MKKQIFIFFTLAIVSLISFTSCEPFIENKITVKNLAEADIHLNIRGQVYDVSGNGGQIIISDFKKGTFEFETIYDLPAYPISQFTAEGDVSGQLVLNAGTEILLIYSSTTTGEADQLTYTVYGSMTSSDDINRPDPFGTGE